MNIRKYMAFIKTVEYASFTKAAEAMNYTQSGVSRMIRDLEIEWGISLLERGRSGVELTSDGLKLLPMLQRICNDHEMLMSLVDSLHDMYSGLIRIGTFSSVATHWLPNMIKIFQQDYPKIEFELLLGDYTEIENWIHEGRVDFGFLRLPANIKLETVPLENDRLLVILPENHPFANCDKFPIKELENNVFLLLEKGAKAEISAIFEQNHITPQVNFTTWDDYAIMSMVESGLGISILPELILQRIPYHIISKELEIPAYRSIGVAMRNQSSLSLAARRFLEYLPFRKRV
ncbi:LysR family transcriptional regulator [Sporomusa ovata]|uniref:LysR family transcriptional regulator STM2281 n=1 Tax=Sporomusa ovata TaxID=2378 RepID=A0A0U1L2J1_9FIRM|nr:LysR family transcriptional regulator [Sporomusa ovata]CQR73745.1 LysR family transcriptional regulator STM2281 [Sporomusa ovata]